MSPAELREEIAVELEAMEVVVNELAALRNDVVSREPTLREKTAAAAFLAQFYNGVENILKRITVYHDVQLATGETWHVELFKRFAAPAHPELPELFDEQLANELAPYRRFRHVVFHSYGFQLEWSRMYEGVEGVDRIFARLKGALDRYLQALIQPDDKEG